VLRSFLVVGLAIAALTGCFDPKTRTFFDPFTGEDVDSPLISFLTPQNAILSGERVCFRVTDEGGFDISGISASNVVSFPVLPLTMAGEFAADISAAAEGPHTVRINVTDLAGNEAESSVSVNRDVTAPTIDNFTVPADQSSSAPSLTLNWSWRIDDANLLNLSHFELRDAGPDGQVGTGDDVTVPEGTGGGQADDPVQDVTCTNGECSVEITIFNGVTMPGDSRTRRYFGMVDAFDQAKGNCGDEDNPNTADANSPPVIVVWRLDPPTTGDLTVTVRVGGQVQQGAQVQISGPGGTATATTDASGIARFEDRQPGAHSITTTLTGHVCPGATGNVVAGQTTNVDVNCTAAPQDFTVNVTVSYRHIGPGSSETCVEITTSPPQPGASYTVTWSGPGTVGGTTRSGTLDSNGRATDRQPINQFGTYTVNVSVTAGGVTRTANGSTNVTSAQGACLAPSSLRFKRRVVSLLPEGMTILGLRPVSFRYVAPYGDPAVPQVGLIAEEVARVYPIAVAFDAPGRPEGIYYGVLTGLLIETLESRARQALGDGVARLAEALE
jgi:hypothetical protein